MGLENLARSSGRIKTKALSMILASSIALYGCKDPNISYPDTTSPVLTLVGENSINLPVGSAYTELGARATDNVDGDLTSKIVVSGAVDANTPGIYTITYNVSDVAGNPSHITRVINVFDEPPETPPVLVEKMFLISDRAENSDIYMMNPDGSNLEQLTDTSEFECFISVSRDGKNMAYSVYPDGLYFLNEESEIAIMSTDKANQNKRQLTDNDYFDGFVLFSYDGKSVFFSSYQNENIDLYRMNIDNRTLTQVTDTPDENEILLAISPNGEKLLFTLDVGEGSGLYDLFTINSDGTSEISTRLTEDYIDNIPFSSYSPDGSMIAFNSSYSVQDPYDPNRSFIHSDIGIIASDGTEQDTLIETNDYDEFFPVWSPNGMELGYSAYYFTEMGDYYGNFEIYVKSSFYTKKLTSDPAENVLFAWARIPSY